MVCAAVAGRAAMVSKGDNVVALSSYGLWPRDILTRSRITPIFTTPFVHPRSLYCICLRIRLINNGHFKFKFGFFLRKINLKPLKYCIRGRPGKVCTIVACAIYIYCFDPIRIFDLYKGVHSGVNISIILCIHVHCTCSI